MTDAPPRPATGVTVLVAAGLAADRDLLAELAGREFAALGAEGRLVVPPDAASFATALDAAGADPGHAVVALPGADPEVRALMEPPRPYRDRLVWLDLGRTGPRPAGGALHLYGRGVGGLTWAVRAAAHRVTCRPRRVAYGPHPDQYAELLLPDAGPAPVAMLLHGGFYRTRWAADLMDALAADLAGRGFAAWNVEYRRPDRHGWAATVSDVAEAYAALQTLGGDVDPARVAVIGHSAGGQLALRLAADLWAAGRGPALAVSLAGLVDLVECDLRDLSGGATALALGGRCTEIPDVYAASSPLARLPLGGPQLVVQGTGDDPDLVDFNRRYARAATADPVTYLEAPGDHFSVIDPATPIWAATAARVEEALRPAG
ncbi:alpha/beta hydrolase fold protein [Nonomuraea coxensis DSM 45129]|uniref:Alpha/beta hydrolase fold protein n=1 Tax=Nonomuraea coxensis DSM 45129 TaxID=1122611 RepID=A0ABX8UCS4_9ACTN|nr:alpha/beta hydrolase [Nonomuraea coxensis]QYC45580.1 alpha/beta hydrolase fold protein [Nonomuraea coxensis DSM 45129]